LLIIADLGSPKFLDLMVVRRIDHPPATDAKAAVGKRDRA
jgi:hypothetical protein